MEKNSIEWKISDLRERIELLEEMEENRVMLFTSFGLISILVSFMGGIFIFSGNDTIDPYDLPALYIVSSIFFLGGLFMLWRGLRSDDITLQLSSMKRKLLQFEEMVFASEFDNYGREND